MAKKQHLNFSKQDEELIENYLTLNNMVGHICKAMARVEMIVDYIKRIESKLEIPNNLTEETKKVLGLMKEYTSNNLVPFVNNWMQENNDKLQKLEEQATKTIKDLMKN